MVTKLLEGGNVFKDAKGQPATGRIAKDNVIPTVQWLEQLTGLNLVDNMLGSTGRVESSGDLDLGVDASKVSKDVLIQQLLNKGVDRNDIRKTGDAVHYKAPILGNTDNGFVQVDFMFTENPNWQHFYMAGGVAGSKFKGVHRNILMASLAKARGLKFSPKAGLVDRATNETITQDPDEIAGQLLGQGHTAKDLVSVETIINSVKGRPEFEQLVADAREAFAKDGLQLPESSVQEGTANWFRNWSSVL